MKFIMIVWIEYKIASMCLFAYGWRKAHKLIIGHSCFEEENHFSSCKVSLRCMRYVYIIVFMKTRK